MSIQDLEIFLATYKNESNKFSKVVEVMLNPSSKETEYSSVLNILNDQHAINNFHFVEEKDYLKKLIDKLEIAFD